MKRRPLPASRLFLALIFVFLYAPIAILIAFSFNASKSRTIWSGFTLDWYGQLIQDGTIMSSLWTTLTVSVLAALVATAAGTFAAIGLYNMRRRWQNPLLAVSNIPVINADIVTGVSLCLLFVSLGSLLKFDLGFGTLLIAHITFDIPFVVLSVMPKLRQLDRNLVDAAQDLAVPGSRLFIRSSSPRSSPALSTASLSPLRCPSTTFVVSYFTAGSKVQTLSMTIFAMTRKRISPKINAVSTLLFVFVLMMLLIVNIREVRQEARVNKQKAIHHH